MNILNRAVLDRRTLLRAGAVSIALPFLDAMVPSLYSRDARAAAAASRPRRMVLIHRPLGTYHPHMVPQATGLKDETTRFLKTLEPCRIKHLRIGRVLGIEIHLVKCNAFDSSFTYVRCKR